MTLEIRLSPSTHGGDFDDLVSEARRQEVVEYYVWSPSRRTFEKFDSVSVRIVE